MQSTTGGSQSLDARLLRFRNRPGSEEAAPLAEALLSARRHGEALEVAALGLSRTPEDVRLLLVQGQGWLQEGELLQAQAALLKAARAAPQSKEPFRWLGEVLLKRGDPERAAKVVERALRIDPNDGALHQLHERAQKGTSGPARSPVQGTVQAAPAGAAERPFAGRAARPAGPAAPPARPAPPLKATVPQRPAPGARTGFEDDDEDAATVIRSDLADKLPFRKPPAKPVSPPRPVQVAAPPPPEEEPEEATTVAAHPAGTEEEPETWISRPEPLKTQRDAPMPLDLETPTVEVAQPDSDALRVAAAQGAPAGPHVEIVEPDIWDAPPRPLEEDQPTQPRPLPEEEMKQALEPGTRRVVASELVPPPSLRTAPKPPPPKPAPQSPVLSAVRPRTSSVVGVFSDDEDAPTGLVERNDIPASRPKSEPPSGAFSYSLGAPSPFEGESEAPAQPAQRPINRTMKGIAPAAAPPRLEVPESRTPEPPPAAPVPPPPVAPALDLAPDPFAPSSPGGHAAPSSPGGHAAPSTPGGYGAPSSPGGYAAPSSPGGHAAPSSPGGYAAPSSPGGHAAPSSPGGYGAPSSPGGYAAPSSPGGYAAPSSPGGHAAPSTPGGYAAPSSPGGHAAPSSPGGYAAPSSPGGYGAPSSPGGYPAQSTPGEHMAASSPGDLISSGMDDLEPLMPEAGLGLEPGEPPSPTPDVAVGAGFGQAENVDSVLRMLEREGLFEAPSGEAGRWAEKKETEKTGTRVGRAMIVVWVIALLLGGGGYYGWMKWVEHKHEQAAAYVQEAWRLAFAGNHKDLVDAERKLRLARDLNPKDTEGPKALLFVHAQRALEDGAFQPGFIRATIAYARRSGADENYIRAAEAVLAVSEGAMDSAREHMATAVPEGTDDAALLYIAGRVSQRLGDEDAVARLQAAIDKDATLVPAAIALAEARADEGQREQALQILDGVLSRSPHHLRASLWKAFLTADEADPDPALAALTSMTEHLDDVGAPTDHVLAHLTRARLLRRKGENEQAADEVEQASAAGATEPRLLALVAAESLALGRLRYAHAAATNAVQGAPSNPDFRKLLAQIQIERRDGLHALQTLSQLSGDDPEALRLRVKAAIMVGTQEAVQAAAQMLTQYLENNEDASVEMKALLLRARVQLGQGRDVLADARRLAQDNPGDPYALVALGEAALDQRDPRAAKDALEKLVQASPDDAQAHYLLGRAQRMAGDASDAEQSFRRALELSPEHTDASVALGYLLLDQGKYAEADELYQGLARRSGYSSGMPLSLVGRLGRVEALLGLGRVDDAAVQWDGVRAEDRERGAARIVGGRLALARGQAGEAVTALRPLAERENASADVIALYADALDAAGEGDAAGTQYERALGIDAGHPEALVGFARVLLRAEKLNDAEEKIERAERSLRQRTRPPRFRAQMLILQGRILLAKGRNNSSRARTPLRQASEIEGAPPEVWFWLGESLAGLNSPEAREVYNHYLELEPHGQYAARARRAIR